MQTCKLEQVVHYSKNILSKEQLNKINYPKDWKNDESAQDGDCKLRRAQKQPKQPRIEAYNLQQEKKDWKNTVIQKNRCNKQRSRWKNDQYLSSY